MAESHAVLNGSSSADTATMALSGQFDELICHRCFRTLWVQAMIPVSEFFEYVPQIAEPANP